MKTFRKKFFALLMACPMSLTLYSCLGMSAPSRYEGVPYSSTQSAVSPYGIYTHIAIFIEGKNGRIHAWAKNIFTLFPSIVPVYVELYSSTTYQDSCAAMKLETYAYTSDLDQGEQIETSISTNGQQKYWKARARFRLDGSDWAITETATLLYNAAGEVIG